MRNRPHQPNHRITKLALALSLHLANCNKKVHHIIRNPSKGFLESLGIIQFDLENLPTFRPIQRKTKMVVFFLSSISARCISALRNPRRPHQISHYLIIQNCSARLTWPYEFFIGPTIEISLFFSFSHHLLGILTENQPLEMLLSRQQNHHIF